jgi:hypothetical protein
MTSVAPVPTATSTETSFVEWGAVFAGAVIAVALSFVLFTFGATIGLSAVSPWPNAGLSAKAIASLAVFWALIQQIGAFMAGGYVAGRIRSRWGEAIQHEVEFRDGVHGGLVWAVGVVVGAALLVWSAGAVTKTSAQLVGHSSSPNVDVIVDRILRPTSTSLTASATASAPVTRGTAMASTEEEVRAEVSRLLVNSTSSQASMSAQDRGYLAQIVAQHTGVSQPEAEQRVDAALTATREVADKARHAAILSGFVAAASLIISLSTAWWASIRGGHHRDNSVPARFAFGDRRRPMAMQ